MPQNILPTVFISFAGARVDIRNKEGKVPLDLAREPETAALLQRAFKPVMVAEGYGDEEDSD